MQLAAELELPLVTVIDTAGRGAVAGGRGGRAGRGDRPLLADLVLLDAPTVCLLLGEGAGGGALALLPADRVVCAQHAWLSPLPPEGASAIIHRTTERAPEMAEAQGVRSLDLLRDGIVDRVVAEHPDAADEPAAYLERLGPGPRARADRPAPPRPAAPGSPPGWPATATSAALTPGARHRPASTPARHHAAAACGVRLRAECGVPLGSSACGC